MKKMQKQIKLTMLAIVANIAVTGVGQVIEAPYQVGVWKNFTDAAITYTFDDNCSKQYDVAIPLFNEYGFSATFYPVINWSPNWSIFQAAANNGHEIGSHTISHTDMSGMLAASQDNELKNSQATINSNISGQLCQTLSYPYCSPSIDTITKKYFIAARHCQGNIEKTTPTDFYNISSIMCGSEGNIRTATQFNNKANSAISTKGWVVYLIHGVDNDGGYSSTSSAVLRESLEYLDYHQDKFWVSSFVNVVKYIRERNCVSVDEIENSSDTIRIQVTDTLDNAVYNTPVSISRPLPIGWEYALANQNGSNIDAMVKEIESVKYIIFDAIPDGGIVTLTPTTLPAVVPQIDKPFEVGTWKNFTDAAITYTFDDFTSKQYSVAIPMLNEFNFDATFFPIIDWSPNWTSLQTAVNSGHEVGSHTISHPHLGELSDSLQNIELKSSQATINSNITGQSCLTIAYPFCEPSDDTITTKYYIAARNCQGYIEKSTPDNFFNISSISCGSAVESILKTAVDFQTKADSAATLNGWNVYLVHGIDDDGGYSPLTSSILRSTFEYLDTNREKFWVSNFGNVVRYIHERNALSVDVTEVYSDSIRLNITDTLDNIVYNVPVSIRRTLPYGWVYAGAYQNGDSIDTRIKTINTINYIEFNAVPDGGSVTIKKMAAPAIPDTVETNIISTKERSFIKVFPNPFYTETNIETNTLCGYFIHSLDGRLVEKGTINYSKSVGRELQIGIYYLVVESDAESLISKIIKVN